MRNPSVSFIDWMVELLPSNPEILGWIPGVGLDFFDFFDYFLS